MKNSYIITVLFFLLLAMACGKDDAPAPEPGQKSSAKEITGFVFRAADNGALQTDVTATVNEGAKTVSATFPHGTTTESLLPLITVSENATITPQGKKDFSTPITYIVTAEDGSEAIYKASANTAPSDKKQLLDFRFLASKNNALVQDVLAEIDQEKKTVTATMPAGMEITALEPSVGIPVGATLEPEGTQNFTEPVKYTVTAADGSRLTYTVTLTVPLTEKEILLMIAANDPTGFSTTWKAENDIRDFSGVQVDGNGRVIKLSVNETRLQELPPEIGQLQSLEELDFEENALQTLPPEIGQLRNLIRLKLLGNELSELPPEIGELTNLEVLYLDYNNLTALPSEFAHLVNLRFLTLRENRLAAVPFFIGQLESLERLHLASNMLETIPPEIGQLALLESLGLSDNKLQSLPSEIGLLESLERLVLSENQLGNLPSSIGNMVNLNVLDLDSNLLESLPSDIGNLLHLNELHLHHNSLGSVPSDIGELINLKALSLNDNELRSVPIEMGQLVNLDNLWMSGNENLRALPGEVCRLDKSMGGSTSIDIIEQVFCLLIDD